jgi:hypothetical protein
MQIVNFFYELAREHKRLNGFIYGRSYEKGAANEAHPLLWLDDPILGTSAGNTVRYTINMDVLGIPANDTEVLAVQNEAFTAGLSIIERIKVVRPVSGFSIDGFNFLTLRDYYDNNAAGVRFTLTVIQANPVDRCADDFDPTKQFPKVEALPDFLVDNPDGCAIFNDGKGLPNFKITI